LKPIILLGTERSGTNLLRRTIGAHSQIAAPPPSGLIANMAPYRHKYLNGRVSCGVELWVRVALALIDSHPSDWEMKFSVEDILERIEGEPSHWKLFQILNELYAERHGASYWFSKEPGGLDWAYELLMNLPDAKFIYLVRDGRDVAASMLKGGVHEHHILGAAMRWSHDQVRGMQYLSDPLMKEKIFLIRYEDFLSSPDQTTESLFDFLGCDYESGILNSHSLKSAAAHSGRSEFWKNISKPIMKDNFGKYRKNISRYQVHVFETIAREQLTFFDYKCDFRDDVSLSFVKRSLMKVHAKFNKNIRLRDPKVKNEFTSRKRFFDVTKKLASSDTREELEEIVGEGKDV